MRSFMEGLESCPLDESTTFLKIALQAAQAGSWACDLVTGEIFWSEELNLLIGMAPPILHPSRETCLERIHPEDREPIVEQVGAALAQRREIQIEFRLLRMDGAVRWVRSQGQTLYSPTGEPLRMIGVTFDVTDRKLTEEALRQREEHLRVITDGLPVLISYVDAEERYRFINARYESWFGRPPEAIEGKPVLDVVGDTAYQAILPHLRSVLSGQEVRFTANVEYEGVGRRWVEARYVPHLDRERRVLGFFAMVNDITDHKRIEQALRESEDRFRTAVENMLDCLGIYSSVRDAEGTIVDFRTEYVNAAACANNLMPREEQVGRLLCEILPGHRESGLFAEYCAVVETGEPLIKETLFYEDHYSGQRLMRSFDIRAVKLGDGFMAVWRDVTERKRIEQALQESDRRKDEFLAMLAHELRNPLAPIHNAVQVIKHLGQRDPQLDRMRGVIERQTDQLTRMVEDLLDVSRISQGKVSLRKEPVDLVAIVGRAVETSRPLIDASAHRLSVSLPPESLQIEGDVNRLAQVLSNLLNNAAKYTESGGEISLTAERREEEVELRVKDSGIGMSADVLPRVFDLFAQADRALDRAQGGLGIGLTLVRSLVEMHGGTVKAFSAGQGKGSEITVRLPLLTPRPAEKAVERGGPSATAPSVRCRILVVDDNVDSAQSLSLLLTIEGHDVRMAHDGREGIEMARGFHPQVVLLDIGLPQMSGYEVAVHLRKELALHGSLFIALTGYGQPEDRQRSKDAGFDHHLVKPVDFEELRDLIVSHAGCL